MNSQLPTFNSILIRGVDTVGTFVLATPFYRELRKNFPTSYIALCIKPLVYDLAKNCPYVNEIIVYDKKNYGGEFGFIKELKKQKFDAVFILSGSFHSALTCYFAGIKVRIGYPHDRRWFLLTHKVPDNDKHCVEYLLEIIEFIGGKVESKELELWFSEGDLAKGLEFLKSSGLNCDDKIIGVGFGVAGESARQWLTDKWINLVKLLVVDDFKVVLFGTKNDILEAMKIEEKVEDKNLVNLVGKTNLLEFAAVVKNCRLYISVDTGGIHIASALGVPVIGLYIPGSDIRWGPRGENVITIAKNTNCAPCNQHKMRHCKNNICMKSITVDEVYNQIGSIIQK